MAAGVLDGCGLAVHVPAEQGEWQVALQWAHAVWVSGPVSGHTAHWVA